MKSKKSKTPKEATVQVKKDRLEDVEIEDFDDVMNDELLEGLSKVSIKKFTSNVCHYLSS
jgi:hypothetical protein